MFTNLVRTRDDSQLAELKAAGASEVVPELLESSLMLAPMRCPRWA